MACVCLVLRGLAEVSSEGGAFVWGLEKYVFA